MNIKILDESSNKTVELKVVDSTTINSSAILNVDTDLNNTTKIELVNKALNIVQNEKLLTKFQNKVKAMSKRNTLIPYEYNKIKDEIFKEIESNNNFDEINVLINEKLMLLEIVDEKVNKVYNQFDFWYTHNDQKLEKMTNNYLTLQQYKKLYDNNVGKK